MTMSSSNFPVLKTVQPPTQEEDPESRAYRQAAVMLMHRKITPKLAQFVLLASLELHPENTLDQMAIRVEERHNDGTGFVHFGTGLVLKEFRRRGNTITMKFSNGDTRNFDLTHATSFARIEIMKFMRSPEGAALQAATISGSPPRLRAAIATA